MSVCDLVCIVCVTLNQTFPVQLCLLFKRDKSTFSQHTPYCVFVFKIVFCLIMFFFVCLSVLVHTNVFFCEIVH